jgi:uncharacterized membrane protein
MKDKILFTLNCSLYTGVTWIQQHLAIIILGLVFFIAAFIRFWAASISTGPDVEQFFAFGRVFKEHGLDFYRYANAQLDIFPMKGWGFFYPPVWLLFLGLALFIVPTSLVNGEMVASTWRFAMKTPIITADLAIGLLLFWAVRGSKWRKLLFASLWFLHPTAWFESGVFGQFDAIAAAFLLASIIFLIKGKDIWAFIFAALALMTKQHTFAAVIMMIIVCARSWPMRRLITNCAILCGTAALISIPFLVTGNFMDYAHSLFVPGSPPGYQDPLCFSFSGGGALLTQLHNVFGWDTTGLISYTTYILIAALLFTGFLCYKRRITALQGMLAGFLVFIAFYYRINYQYLVIYIPLALLVAARTQYKWERFFALIIAMLPAVWLWITNIPWWFYDDGHGPAWIKPIFAHIGLPERYLPDLVYVIFAGLIMCTAIAYVVLIFTKWQQRDNAVTNTGNDVNIQVSIH